MIYVDQIFKARPKERQAARLGVNWCHLWSSTHDIEELIAFAQAIGMRPQWLQSPQRFPHFDLVPRRRAAALKAGAIEYSLRKFIREQQVAAE